MIFQRGVKYPDNVINFTKSSVTIMLCISASGDILPPYVVYKAANLWDSWREGGPKGAPCCEKKCCAKGSRYNRSNHGWFDAICFTDWFKTCFLPHAKLLDGRKVLIGDNLSSHFTKEVLQLCKRNNIDFVCLPPNATHLCQPLDVSFFGPMKNYWKQILVDWKKSNPKTSAVEKSLFPRLLKKLIDKITLTARQNAISGFSACGIYPLSKEKLLAKIPHQEQEDVPRPSVSETIVDYLKAQRNPSKKIIPAKRKKLNIVPGRSVAAEDSPDHPPTTEENLPSTSKTQSVKRKIMQSDSEAEELDIERSSDPESESEDIQESENLAGSEVNMRDGGSVSLNKDDVNEISVQDVKVNSWVLVEYLTKKTVKHYMGKIKSLNNNEAQIKFVRKYKSNNFSWPNIEDCDFVPISQIKRIVNAPKVGRRDELYFDFNFCSFNIQ